VEWVTELSLGESSGCVTEACGWAVLDLNLPQRRIELRVKSLYFAVAWQPFVVTKSNAHARCEKAMEVRLALPDDAVQSLNPG